MTLALVLFYNTDLKKTETKNLWQALSINYSKMMFCWLYSLLCVTKKHDTVTDLESLYILAKAEFLFRVAERL